METTATEELDRWVDRKAAELDADRAEVVERALAAYRVLEASGDALRSDAAGAGAESTDLEARVSDLEADLDEKVTDLRERVIQIKREADRRAAESGEHPDSEGSTAPARATDAVSDLGESLSTLESRVEAGFENYEGILEYLVDAADENEEKLDATATAVVDLRRRVSERERADAERAAAGELKRDANREGVTRADCEACGGSVALALLEAPYCPHCEETFDGVRARGGLLSFGPATLTVEPADETAAATASERTPMSTDSVESTDPTESDAPREAADSPEAGGD